MSAALTLVSHPLCPYVQRAAIALAEKGVAFDRRVIDLAAKPDWFSAISPLGKVPLLIVRGEPDAVLFESAAICDYIEESQAGPLLHPENALERARHRAWIEFASSVLADIWGLETAREAESYAAKEKALAAKFQRVEAELGQGPYFAGDMFSLVDAAFAPAFRYFEVFGAAVEASFFGALPKLRAWRQALSRRASVREAVAPDYAERLRRFLADHQAHLLRLK